MPKNIEITNRPTNVTVSQGSSATTVTPRTQQVTVAPGGQQVSVNVPDNNITVSPTAQQLNVTNTADTVTVADGRGPVGPVGPDGPPGMAGTTVIANPMGTDGDDLTRITIGGTDYNLASEGTTYTFESGADGRFTVTPSDTSMPQVVLTGGSGDPDTRIQQRLIFHYGQDAPAVPTSTSDATPDLDNGWVGERARFTPGGVNGLVLSRLEALGTELQPTAFGYSATGFQPGAEQFRLRDTASLFGGLTLPVGGSWASAVFIGLRPQANAMRDLVRDDVVVGDTVVIYGDESNFGIYRVDIDGGLVVQSGTIGLDFLFSVGTIPASARIFVSRSTTGFIDYQADTDPAVTSAPDVSENARWWAYQNNVAEAGTVNTYGAWNGPQDAIQEAADINADVLITDINDNGTLTINAARLDPLITQVQTVPGTIPNDAELRVVLNGSTWRLGGTDEYYLYRGEDTDFGRSSFQNISDDIQPGAPVGTPVTTLNSDFILISDRDTDTNTTYTLDDFDTANRTLTLRGSDGTTDSVVIPGGGDATTSLAFLEEAQIIVNFNAQRAGLTRDGQGRTSTITLNVRDMGTVTQTFNYDDDGAVSTITYEDDTGTVLTDLMTAAGLANNILTRQINPEEGIIDRWLFAPISALLVLSPNGLLSDETGIATLTPDGFLTAPGWELTPGGFLMEAS